MHRMLPILLTMIVCTVVSNCCLLGCGSSTDSGFKYERETATPVAGSGYQEVVDSGTGLTFAFPEGGDGVLTTAVIKSGPKRPLPGGQGFRAEFSGSQPVVIKIAHQEGDYDAVLGWGATNGSIDDGRDAEGRWIGLAVTKEEAGFLHFELPLAPVASSSDALRGALSVSNGPGIAALALPMRRGYKGFGQFWVIRTTATSTDTEKRRNIAGQVADDIENWLTSLPTALQAAARTETTGRLRFRVYEDGNYYIGFTRRSLGNTTTPMLGLELGADAQNIAHEVGHYMNHVLVGDVRYLPIEDLAPDANHGLAVLHAGRTTVTEDYAYFSQYFLTGSLGAGDPTQARQFLNGINPATIDFPSVEGFACLLMAYLTRTDTRVLGVTTGKPEDVPAVGASMTDMLGLIAQGNTNINALRDAIQAYLDGRGEGDKLPAIAERIGWSYHGKGQVVSNTGRPVGGATIQALSKVGTTEYTTPEEATSGGDGMFTLDRVFPGRSLLRVKGPDGQVVDVAIEVPWTEPTDKVIDLKQLALGPGQLGPECQILAACCPNLPSPAVIAQCEGYVRQADETNCHMAGTSLLRLCQ